jgi:hypothetical protein
MGLVNGVAKSCGKRGHIEELQVNKNGARCLL